MNVLKTSLGLGLAVVSACCFSVAALASDRWHVKKSFVLPSVLPESSALLYAHGSLWSINDSGHDAVIYRLSLKGRLVARVRVRGAPHQDWEAMAQDARYVYVGDVGNNAGTRSVFSVARIRWTDLLKQSKPRQASVSRGTLKAAGIIRFTLPDYRPGGHVMHYHAFDMEAMLVRGASLWVFSKDGATPQTQIYLIPKQPGRYRARLGARVATPARITDACWWGRDEVGLLGYRVAGFHLQPFWMRWVFSNKGTAESALAAALPLHALHGQTEGLACDRPSERLWLTREVGWRSGRLYLLGR